MKKAASLPVLLISTVLHEVSTTFAAKALVMFTGIIKPRLTASEVSHHLAPSEGQKELARRLESRAENTKMEVTTI